MEGHNGGHHAGEEVDVEAGGEVGEDVGSAGGEGGGVRVAGPRQGVWEHRRQQHGPRQQWGKHLQALQEVEEV